MTQPLDPIVPAGSDGAASASTRDTYFEAIGRHEVLDTEAFLASYRQSMNAVAPLESFGLRPRLRHALMMSAFRARKLAARLKGRRGVPFSAHLDALPDRTHLRLTIRDPAPSGTLTDEERTFFSTYGLLPPRRVAGLEGERLDDLHEELLAMTMGSRAGATHMHLVSERVLDLAMEPSILGVVKSLLGDDVAVSNSSGFVKPPRTGVTTQWHSATPKSFAGRYAPEDRYCVNQVTVWIALTDAREDNGCMMMVPRSFIADVFDEFLVALQQIDRGDTFLDIPDEWMSERIRRGRDMKYAVDDKTAMEANAYFETVQQLFKLGFNETCDFFPRLVRANGLTAVKLEADPGDFYVFTSKNVHCAFPNRSDRRRSAISIRYLRTRDLLTVEQSTDSPCYADLKDKEPYAKPFAALGLPARKVNALVPVCGRVPPKLAEHFIAPEVVRRALRSVAR